MNDLSHGQHHEPTAEQQWEQFTVLKTANDYIDSLRGRNLDVYLLSERIEKPVDHPIVRPSINAMAESYICLLYTSPSPRDLSTSRMPSSA